MTTELCQNYRTVDFGNDFTPSWSSPFFCPLSSSPSSELSKLFTPGNTALRCYVQQSYSSLLHLIPGILHLLQLQTTSLQIQLPLCIVPLFPDGRAFLQWRSATGSHGLVLLLAVTLFHDQNKFFLIGS